jgi:alpha-tubulin suppressor-like RCC1 family protein
VTVLYEVNQAINTFEGIVKYQVENEVEPRIETTVEGYINEVKGIPVEAIAGYKVKTDPVQPTTITILADGSAVATVLYEVDTNQRIFKGTVKYQVAGEENARITKEVTGCYIGEKAPIPAELINGYKVKTDPVQPTTITILENNSATATVLYEVNQNVKTFIGKVHHQIEGAELPFATDELTGYIGEVKTIVYQQRTGYKVKETVPAQPTTIKITEDGKAEVTIIYVIDTLSTAFSAKVHHKVEGEETARFIDTHNGHINEVKDITHRNINGYKVKVTDPAQPTTIKILEDNSAVETILYVVDQDIKTFKGMVYYRVGNEPTPRHSEEVKGYIGQVVPIPEHDINGYKVKETVPAQPTTITIKEDNTAIVYVLYEVNQTVKTFSGIIEYRVLGEETARKETTVTGYIGEVIGITPHGIAGYKVVEGAPTTITIKESNNAKAIVYYEIDHEYKFFTGQVFHKINGVTKDTDDFTGYIKQEHSITNKTYPGYRVDTNQPTSIIITEDNKATRTVNYVKESSQWTTITFAPGSNATLTGATTYYEVIKNHPLNGDNQPPITKPTINPNLGYKVNDTQDWLPAFATTNMVSEPTTYTANVIVDTEQLFVYKVNYLEQGTNDVLRTALEDTHYIGNLPLIHPEIPGYLIVGEQLASIDIVAVEGTDINELTIYYVKDNTQWTTIKFVSGINGTGATTMFTVIKDHPLNGDNQPTITPPTFTAKNGYKLVVEDPWVPTFALTNEVADVTIYEANMVVDTNQLFPYQVKYLLQGTETSLHDPLTGDLCIGNHKLDHPTIPGYQVVLGEPDSIDIVAVTHPHINAINVYYEENSSQWTTITFAPGPNATLTGTFEYDVIKDHPLNGAHQPDIVVPNIIPDHEYMLVEATPWLPAFDLANQVAEATTYTANVVARTKVNIHRNIGIIKIISSQQSSSRAILTQDKELYYVGQAAFYAYPSVPAITEFTMFDRSLINNEVIKDFVMGEYHYMILTELGNVYVWGQNNEGQLGLGHRNDVAQPTLLTTDGLYNNETIIRLFAGPDHSAFLTRNNDTGVISLYTFGYNASGQLGLRDRTRRITPTLVNPDDYGNKAIKDIVLSIHNLAILTEDGILYMSGSNYSGQMTDVVSLVPQAKLVEITTVGKVKQVTMGHDHTVIINEHDEAYAFGHNRFGQLGIPINPNNPNQSNKTPTPQLLLNGQKVQFVNAGKEWTFVYTMDNKLYATGENTDQQLGLNSSVANVTPLQLVPAAHYGNQRLIAVSAGDDNTSFVTVNNDIYACGGNENGELGLGHQNSPVAIPQLSVGAEPVVTYYAKPADTLDSGAVHTLTKMLTEYLSKAGYTFEVYSDSSYSTPINLTDLVGSVERNIYIRYIQDETEWTTITFDVGSNAITDDETVFNVIKNVPLNDPSQPEIVLPTVIAKSGYVVDPNNPWLPAFDQTATLSGPMTYVVNLIKLEQRTIEYYIEGQTELYSTAIVEGVVGQSVSIPTPEIPGYVLRGGQTLTVEILAPSSPPHPSVPIYYDKDTTQWVELTFNGGDKTSVVDGGVNNTVALEVIKDHPLNGVNQPAIPTYTITNTDYYNESPTELWTLNSVIISQDIVITDAMIASGTTLVPYITKRTKVNVYMPIYVYDFNVSSDYTELLSSYGNIYKFGNNDVGQLGFDDVTASNYPTQLHPNTYNFEKVKQIVSSQTHSAIVTDSNKLYVYGNNEFGQLGLDDNLRRVEPTQLILPDYDEVDKVYLGENNTLIIAKSGNVYVFGDNRYGQLGLDIADDYINTPVLVSPSRYGNVAAKSAAVNGGVIAIINSNDQLYVAGRNDQGQLGLGDNNNRSTLTLLPATNYDGATINSIHLGSDHSAIVDNNGNVYMFGANDQGQLGLGHTNNRNVPTLLSLPSSQDVEHITLGNKRTLIVTTDGKLYAMGTNANGEFGDGTTIGSNVPKLIPASSYGNKPIIKVATGNTHTGILTNDNMLYLTGLNTYGQLGTSDNVSIKTPNNIKKVVQVYYAKADETLSEGLYYSFDMSLSEFLYRRGYTYQIYTNYDEVTNTYSNLISDTDLVGDIERSIHINYTVNEADQFSKMVSYNVLDNPALNTTGLVTGYLFENVLIPNPNIKGYMIDPEGMTIVTMNKEETEVIIVNMVVNPEDWTQVTFDVPAGSATLNGGTESVVVDVIKDVPLIEQGVIPPTHAFVGYHEQGEGALWPTFDANVAVNGPTTYTLNAVPMPLLTLVFNMPINVYGELNNPVTEISYQAPYNSSFDNSSKPIPRYEGRGLVSLIIQDGYTYTVHDDAGYTGPEIMRTELIGRADRTLYVRFVAVPTYRGEFRIDVPEDPTLNDVILVYGTAGQIFDFADLDPQPVVPGYVKTEPSMTSPHTLTITTDNSAFAIIGYVRDDSQWSTITFEPGADASLLGTTTYEVLNGIPLNDPRQPNVVELPIISPNPGCEVLEPKFLEFAPDVIVSGDTTFIANVVKKPEVVFDQVERIFAGNDQASFLTTNGDLYIVGQNGNGQLGLGATTPSTTTYTLVPRSSYGNKTIAEVAHGNAHTLLLTTDHTVYVWGYNQYGQLGLGNTNNVSTPTVLAASRYANKVVAKVYASSNFSGLLMTDGTLYMMGDNQDGQLTSVSTNKLSPTKISLGTGDYYGTSPIVKVYLGVRGTFIETSDNHLYYFGDNTNAQGIIPGQRAIINPTLVNKQFYLGSGIKTVSAGDRHGFLLNNNSELVASGTYRYSQLGFGASGNDKDRITPQVYNYPEFTGQAIKTVVAGFEHNFVLLENGELYSFGRNQLNQCGATGSNPAYNELPTLIDPTVYNNEPIKDIIAVNNSGMILTTLGNIYVTGNNTTGILGTGSTQQMTDFTNNQVAENFKVFTSATLTLNDSTKEKFNNQTLDQILTRTGYTHQIYLDSGFSVLASLDDLVGTSDRRLYVKYTLIP